MPLLTTENLTKHFGGLVALSDVSFEVRPKKILGLIGPNGAGKTTLFNLISGFLPKTRGRVIFKDRDITKIKPHQTTSLGLCRTFQMTNSFGEMNVLDNVKVATLGKFSGSDCDRKARECIDMVGLKGNEHLLPGELPHGYLKRLDVARALATAPDLLLLDEPFSGLTISEIRSLSKVLMDLKNLGITLMIIEHILRELMPLADQIVVLNFGAKLAEGSPQEIVKNPNVISAYLGKEWDHAV